MKGAWRQARVTKMNDNGLLYLAMVRMGVAAGAGVIAGGGGGVSLGGHLGVCV
jgi:hypothetical protein